MTTATVQTVETGGIALAFDYGPYYERIATSLENISSTLNGIYGTIGTITHLSTTTGVRVHGAHDYTPIIDMYEWYINQDNQLLTESFTSTEFLNFIQSISSITNAMSRFK